REIETSAEAERRDDGDDDVRVHEHLLPPRLCSAHATRGAGARAPSLRCGAHVLGVDLIRSWMRRLHLRRAQRLVPTAAPDPSSPYAIAALLEMQGSARSHGRPPG